VSMRFEKILNMVLLCLMMAMVVTCISEAQAGGDDVDIQKNTQRVNLDSSDVAIGGSRALAMGQSLGDVDINEGQNCMGSEQWGIVVYMRQDMELNPWCAGLFYDANRMHYMAAVMRCDIPDIRQHFVTDEECIEANTVDTEIIETPELGALYSQAAQHEEKEEEDDEKFEYLTQQIEQQQQMIEQIESQRPRVIQQYGITDEKKAKLAEVLKQ